MRAPTWGHGASEQGPGRRRVLAAARGLGAPPAQLLQGTQISVGPLHGWAPALHAPLSSWLAEEAMATGSEGSSTCTPQGPAETTPHMRVVTPCLARPGQTRAVSFPGGTCSLQQGWGGSHTFRLPHRKGPGRGGGDPGRGTFSWTSLTSHSGNLRRAAGAQAPLNAPFPASAPPPPMALQTPSVPCVTWMCRGLSGMTPGLGGWGRFASN